MNLFKLAYRKHKLQRLQVKYLASGFNTSRVDREKAVLRYVSFRPWLLFMSGWADDDEQYAKQLNTLTAKSKNDSMYESLVSRLSIA